QVDFKRDLHYFFPFCFWIEVTLEEYEERSDKQCDPAFGTDAHIFGLGAIRTRADNSGKEGVACFRPEKSQLRPPNGCDKEIPSFIGPEVFRTKISYFHDFRVNPGRISSSKWRILRLDEPPEGEEVPLRMQAWHFCAKDKPRRTADILPRTHVILNSVPMTNTGPTNIQPGQCVINISPDCLYHDATPEATIHRQLLPDPIVLDFLIIRNLFLPSWATLRVMGFALAKSVNNVHDRNN
ncbi:8469_t:CDS:2, partial [Ambispora leptoticha]